VVTGMNKEAVTGMKKDYPMQIGAKKIKQTKKGVYDT